MNDILNKLKTEIPNNTSIIVATSGGPDSMTLLSLLNQIKKEKHLNIISAHVNHNLRKESDKEAIMVKNYCKKNNLIFEYMEINNYRGNTENYARKKRYEFFENLIKKYQAKYLLTAHHGDDLTETIIMRLIRGSSIKGYAGFSEITYKENYKIYRPLITKTKEEIFDYVQKNDIPYALDKTNNSDKFTRNRIRKYILPSLKKENKNIHLKFLKFSQKLIEIDDYLNEKANNIIKEIYQNKKINLNLFLKEKNIIREKIIHNILIQEYKDDIIKITNKHVNNILSTIKSKSPNKKIALPNNMEFIKAYNYAWIEKRKVNIEYNYILKNQITLPNNDIIEIIDDTLDKSNLVTKINSKEISIPIHVRTIKPGDKLTLKGLNKEKKIKDIFINEKVPIDERKTYPIVTDNSDQIIWLPGLKKTKFDREKDKNYDIIIRYQKKGSL